MTVNPSIPILLFFHQSHTAQAQDLKSSLEALTSVGEPLEVILADHTTRVAERVLEDLRGLIVLFSPALERDEALFQLIQAVEGRPRLERFFIFPEEDGKIRFPAIFHAIRSQQHHIFGNPGYTTGELNLDEFREDFLAKFQERLPNLRAVKQTAEDVETHGFLYRLKKFWQGPRRNIFIFSLLAILVLLFGAYLLIPEFFRAVRTWRTPIHFGVDPPEFSSTWIGDSISGIRLENWQESNVFTGTNPFSVTLDGRKLVVNGEPNIDQAIYQLESINQYPLDQLQGFEVDYYLGEFLQNDGSAALTFQIQLVENPGYNFGCSLVPVSTTASLACTIEEPGTTVQIVATESVELKEPHTLILEFLPATYVVRFFSDSVYVGQAAIPGVAAWRGRDFKAVIQVELENLSSGSFSCKLDHYTLARQEGDL